MTAQVSLCLFGVNEVKVKKKKTSYYIVLERAQGPTLFDCNFAETCFTAARGSVLAGDCTQVPHRTPLYRQYTPSMVVLALIFPSHYEPSSPTVGFVAEHRGAVAAYLRAERSRNWMRKRSPLLLSLIHISEPTRPY